MSDMFSKLASLFPKPLDSGFSFGGLTSQTIPSDLASSNGPILAPFAEKGTDRYWMIEALRESMRAVGITNPNPAVGCVLVDSHGKEISRGSTQAFRGLHAEKVAMSQVLDPSRLSGATAYVTLEPCSHPGSANHPRNQSPCIDLFLSSKGPKISRMVISCTDPNPLVNGEGIRKLRESGIQIDLGLLSAECSAWNFPFFTQQKLKRPAVILKWAQTLDGQLADDSHTSKWISGPMARSYTHWLRQRYDAILVGGRTVLTDFPELTVRNCALPHQARPLPVIFDPRGLCMNIDEATQKQLLAKTFNPNRPLVYATTASALKEQRKNRWIEKLEKVSVLKLDSESESRAIPSLMSQLDSSVIEKILGHPLQSIFVEGGPSTLTAFMQAGYADLLHVFISPIITGGKLNRVSPMKNLCEAERLQLVVNCTLGPDILTEWVMN